MIRAELRNNESQNELFKRFRRKVSRSGVLQQVRKKRFFIPDSEKRQIAKKKAMRRERRRMRT
ncbi:MAG TPA: 30S ribosomal protein S21 [Anaerolineales bacterium]|nr:30S ribosomal protein S21 [Anaerolineales bacterium]